MMHEQEFHVQEHTPPQLESYSMLELAAIIAGVPAFFLIMWACALIEG